MNRKNFGAKTYFYPMPVLIIGTFNANNEPNAMNAAWGGVYDTNEIFICLSSDHLTTENIKLNQEFTVAFADAKHVVEADYVGIKTGKKEDKIKKANLRYEKSEFVNAPVFVDFPVSLDCKVKSIREEDGTSYLVASIINVSANKDVLTDGHIDYDKLHIISYDGANNVYLELGKKVGNAFKDGLKIK